MTAAISASAAPPAPSRAQEQTKLNQMMRKYQAGISSGESATVLASLGKQILAEAKVLGVNVKLPKATATPATANNATTAASKSVPEQRDATRQHC